MNILYIAPQKVVTGASLSLIGVVRNLSSHNKIYVIVEDLKTEYAKELIKAGAELIEYKHMPIWLKTKPKSKVKWFAMRIKRIVLNNTIFRF